MKLFKIYLVFAISLLLIGCVKTDDGGVSNSPQIVEKQEVTLCAQSGAELTRTVIGDDLLTANWAVGDTIAIWAMPQSDDEVMEYSLLGESFAMRYFGTEYTSAEFTASISPMAEGDYTYYGVYPKPKSITQGVATITLPSVQSGEYDGEGDIMVATPLLSRELSSSTLGAPELSFNHMMHAFRVEIPDGRNLMGGDLTKLEITFSQSVVGDVEVDVTNPDSFPVITSEASNKVTLEFAESFESGTGRYIWFFVNPTTLSGEVKFLAYGEGGVISSPITTTIEKELVGGAITPLTLTIPEPKITTLRVNLSAANVKSRIGESLQSVAFTAPDGTYIDGTMTSKSFEPSDDDTYEINFYNASDFESTLKGGTLDVWFETLSVEKSPAGFALSGITMDGVTEFTVDVPYFFTTTFTEISASGSTEETATDDDDQETDVPGLTGWVAGERATWTEGSYITIRSYTNAGGPYDSRFNSCTLSAWGLKSTASAVSITISHTAYWSKNKSDSMSIVTGISSSTSLTSTITGTPASTSLTTKVTKSVTVTASGATSTSRIAWKTVGENASWYNYFNYDSINIDNLTVTINGQ